MTNINIDELIKIAKRNKLTKEKFYKLLIKHYNFTALEALKIVAKYE